jgi:hypothetical protein
VSSNAVRANPVLTTIRTVLRLNCRSRWERNVEAERNMSFACLLYKDNEKRRHGRIESN